MNLDAIKIGIIGMGYVGLPLAVECGKLYPTIGFDINQIRINELEKGVDSTLECSPEELATATQLTFSTDIAQLKSANCYIVTVPTPVDPSNRPDLTPLIKASQTIGQVISQGNLVIYESTVYPGATEEECIPEVERISGLKFNVDFFAGYSPERINPGDKVHRLPMIKKVTSGSTPEVADFIDNFYSSIVTAGTHKAPSIKVAEAAKVIENTQRDVNIALVNELALIFNRLGIDTLDVLEAAGSKWNFLPFRPGLVGGHCIGVDPYYLTHKAQHVGYHPEIILAGRRLNDNMGRYIVSEVIKLMLHRNLSVRGAKVLVMGLTFKENCPDIRNSKVVDLIAEFKEYGCNIEIFDPWANPEEVMREYGLKLCNEISDIDDQGFDAVVLTVSHDAFKAMGAERIRALLVDNGILYDVKYILPKEAVDGRL